MATAATVAGYPPAYDATSYFAAGQAQQGFATQTVNLLTAGLSATAIDNGSLTLVYGGRIRSGNAFPPDTGQIQVTFLAADGTTALGTSTASAPNTTDRWALTGGTAVIPVGTRFVKYTFTATREPNETYDELFLDDAYLSTMATGTPIAAGAYNVPAVADTTTGTAQIALTYPVLYVNWVNNAPHTITWNNFGNAGASTQSVKIDLYQETPVGAGLPSEPKFLQTIAAAVSNTGSYTWNLTPAQVPYGTHGLIIQVSLVGRPGVFDRSTEPFTVPENASTYYVNDGSQRGQPVQHAPGSNRNDGVLPSQPLPDIDNVLRNYSLTAGSTINVDPGTYNMITPFNISGGLDYGLGLDQGFTVQGPTNGSAATLTPAIPGNPVNLIQLENANFVTINNLTLTGAGRGILVQNSTNFSSTGVTVTAMTQEGVRVDTNSTVTKLSNLTVSGSGLAGVYINGTAGALTGLALTGNGTSLNSYQANNNPSESSGLYVAGPVASVSGSFSGNTGWGIYLASPGAVSITNSTVFGNADGIYISGNSGQATVGDADLTHNAGNVIHDNTNYGIFATGSVTVAGNVVYDETGTNDYAVELQFGASATENVIYSSQIGIIADRSGSITNNRIYNNVQYGIDDVNSTGLLTVSGNVIYSNAIGIIDQRYYTGTGVQISNNLVYANTTAAITLINNSGVSIINNTIDQPVGRRHRHLRHQQQHPDPQQHLRHRHRHRHQRRRRQREWLRQRLQHVQRRWRKSRQLAGRAALQPRRLAGRHLRRPRQLHRQPAVREPHRCGRRARLCQSGPARLRRRLPPAEQIRRFPRRQPGPDRRQQRQAGVPRHHRRHRRPAIPRHRPRQGLRQFRQ